MQACIDAICMNITHNRCVVTTNGSVDRYAMSLRPSQRLASGRALLAVPLGALHHWKKVGRSAFAVFCYSCHRDCHMKSPHSFGL